MERLVLQKLKAWKESASDSPCCLIKSKSNSTVCRFMSFKANLSDKHYLFCHRYGRNKDRLERPSAERLHEAFNLFACDIQLERFGQTT